MTYSTECVSDLRDKYGEDIQLSQITDEELTNCIEFQIMLHYTDPRWEELSDEECLPYPEELETLYAEAERRQNLSSN